MRACSIAACWWLVICTPPTPPGITLTGSAAGSFAPVCRDVLLGPAGTPGPRHQARSPEAACPVIWPGELGRYRTARRSRRTEGYGHGDPSPRVEGHSAVNVVWCDGPKTIGTG